MLKHMMRTICALLSWTRLFPMLTMNRIAMLLLTARMSAAFMPAQTFARRAFSLYASDNDFDGYSSKVRSEHLIATS